MPFMDLIHPDDRATIIDRYKKRLKGEKLISTYAFKIINKSGLEKTVQINTVLIQWEERPATLNFLRDITQQVEIESQLHQSQKMESIGTLAGGIAHDFNNILTPIMGYTEIMMMYIPEDSPSRERLSGIYTAALRVSELVKQILTFSRQESGELKLMTIQPIIKEALKLIRATIPTTINIKQNLQSDCGAISVEVLEVFRAALDKFDLIITDMQMPNMSGDKLSVELTKIRPEIPVLLCTGFSETMSEEKAISLGIKGFVLKPILMKDLSHKIREVLEKL